jgi:hypothetical protein
VVEVSRDPGFAGATPLAVPAAGPAPAPAASIELPAGTLARYLRIRRARPGAPLVVHEFRAFGRFE